MKRRAKCCVFLLFLLVAMVFRAACADIRDGMLQSEHRAFQPTNSASGADAGPDVWVYGGDTVTLTGTGPEDATSFHWEQLAGTPTVTLQPSPDEATVEFTAPPLEIGTILTFRLTVDAPSTQGPTTDEVQVMVRAVNPPKLPLTNIHVLPLDLGPQGLGCRIIWDPVLDAERYEVGIEFDGTIIWLEIIDETSYEVKGMTEGMSRTITIRAINKYGASTLIARVGYVAMRNLARPAALGGKSPPERMISKARCLPPEGPVIIYSDAEYDKSCDSWDGNYKDEDYWGYLWSQPLFFDHVAYFTGEMYPDGGWFLDLKVQYTQDGTRWVDAPIREIYPEYDFSDQREGKKPFARYDLYIPTLRGTGIRIYGTPGGTATFTSIAELEVFGNQTQGPLIVQGLDAEYPEGGTALLDGSLTFSTLGPITSYQWTGPAGITITNATSMVASFKAPRVTADTVYVFSLEASDGTNTGTDPDVRILVKDWGPPLLPDQSVLEGWEVTLDACSWLTPPETTTYLWTQTGGTDVGVTGSTNCIVTFIAPMVWGYEEKLTFRLDVEDEDGDTSSDEVVVTVRNALTWPAYPVTYAATTPYLQNLLHLGTNPTDRLLNPYEWGNITSGFDPLESFGGVRNIRPYPGLAFDFTGTGVQVSRNPMVWMPVFSNTGIFDNSALDWFQMHYNVYVLSPDDRDVRWHVRNKDEVRLFCNEATVLTRDSWDVDVEQVEDGLVADGKGLKKGLNVVTGWYEAGGGGGHFAVGITDLSNVPFPDLFYSFGPSLILTDVYAVRSLPDSFAPGEQMRVDLAIKFNPNNPPTSVVINESVSGIPWTPPDVWIQAPGATIVPPNSFWWVLTGPKNQTLTYWITVPAEVTEALRFAGTVTFGTTTADTWGENVVYPVPSAPRALSVEMLQAAHLSWSAPMTEGTASYNIYRSVNGGAYEFIGRSETTTYTDKWVSPGNQYSYWVTAVNLKFFEGQPSRATPQASMPMVEIRQAEDFNYDGGKFPWTAAVTLPPIEAPDEYTIGTPAEYDFYHPGVECGPHVPPWPPEVRPGVCILIVEEADNPGVFCTIISGIVPGSWYRYGFNVPQAGWIKFEFRVASPNGGTLAAYWDESSNGQEQLIGTVSFNTGEWNIFTWALMEDQIQTTAGVHTLRVKSLSGQINFDAIAVQWNAAPPTRQTIWQDNFDGYTTSADVFNPMVGRWTRGNTTNSAGAWTLWDTAGPDLGTEPPNIAAMEGKYMISDSDLSGEGILLDEEMLSPEVDCANWTKLRLNFNKNYHIYDDVNHTQDAEVDIRSFDPVSGWSSWTNLMHLDMSDVDPAADPPELSGPEAFDLSAYDGRKIQLKFHFFNAEYDFWFAIDDIRVSGQEVPT